MILLKDGVKYIPYEYNSEEELAKMVIEHIKEIFGEKVLFFDPQTVKTNMKIEARSDGIILAPQQNRWYILEVELAKHPLHNHIVSQISKFNIAYQQPESKKKIATTLYNLIRQDPYKTAAVQTQKIEDVYKALTDIIETPPTIVMVIDQKTPELEATCKTLPFQTKVIEFKTYAREYVGIGVHIHAFEPLKEEKPSIPAGLQQILEVIDLMFKGKTYTQAVKIIAKQRGILESAVRDKCTRNLKLNTQKFLKIAKDKNQLKAILTKRYPEYAEIIKDAIP
jgi:Na+-transporting NADH:ubiquinone oxidoreductase subunit NqrA